MKRKILGIRCDITNENEVQPMIRTAAAFGDGGVDEDHEHPDPDPGAAS
jgi:hypothetical protein